MYLYCTVNWLPLFAVFLVWQNDHLRVVFQETDAQLNFILELHK
jgi:hypothetical protein